jgi:hypothetical protein
MKKGLLLALIISFIPLSINANTSVLIMEDDPSESLTPRFENHDDYIRGGRNPMEIIKAIITIGERAWDLVVQGKPVIRSSHQPISVLPQVEGKDIVAMDLENWSLPKAKTFNFVAKSRSGKEYVNFKYSVHFTYGGSYNGKGKFLAGVDITPINIKLGWGKKFDSHTRLLEVVNHGTKEDPLVSALMSITYTIRGMTKTTRMTENYQVVADGRIIPLQ